MCDLHLITPKAKWLPSDYHLCWICQKLAIPHPAGALLSHCGDGLQYETRQICAHPLCSRQSLDYINPPFQTGFTFHHFINRVSGVEDEMSIHSREWGQQLKSRGILLTELQIVVQSWWRRVYFPVPQHDHLLPSQEISPPAWLLWSNTHGFPTQKSMMSRLMPLKWGLLHILRYQCIF